ncbi:MAG: trypsin-like peptidase domain-containing protein [Caldilineaceae bacterium]|nr:trypsin-like peptidase domain-containing protein [Caldilineaceae bacterium]
MNAIHCLATLQQRRGRRDRTLRRMMFLAATLLVLSGAFASEQAGAVERTALQRALQSTVLILVPDNTGDLYGTGSGTIMDADKGLILTNFHVMGDPDTRVLYNDDGFAAIGVMPNDLRGSPVLRYAARMINHDPKYDLALLQITGLLDDSQGALPANLGLTAPPRGNSEDLLPGDRMAVIGYPGLGGATVTYTEGVVSGFLDEDRDGEFEWIKTDTEVNPGNSGGLAIDGEGNFVGVPTAGYSRSDVAGKISLVRPATIALRFYDNFSLGQNTKSGLGARGASIGRGRSAAVSSVEFGDSVTRQSRVTRPLTVFPSGATDIYVSFDFTGFRNGQTFAYVWKIGDEAAYEDSFAWKEGASGATWLHLYSEEGLPDGLYTVEMRLDNVLLHTGATTVGAAGSSAQNAGFGPITFATDVTEDARPLNAGNTFIDVDTIYAVFSVSNMTKGAPWRTRWLYEGEEVLVNDDIWEEDNVRATWVNLTHPDGLPAGEFTLELYIGDRRVQRGSFTVAKGSAAIRVQQINVTGVVRDTDNSRRTISGALVAFLNPGVTVDQWIDADFDETMVHARATSGRNGAYQLDAKVAPGQSYAIVVVHDDYQPIAADAYMIPADASDPYELDMTMQRK